MDIIKIIKEPKKGYKQWKERKDRNNRVLASVIERISEDFGLEPIEFKVSYKPEKISKIELSFVDSLGITNKSQQTYREEGTYRKKGGKHYLTFFGPEPTEETMDHEVIHGYHLSNNPY